MSYIKVKTKGHKLINRSSVQYPLSYRKTQDVRVTLPEVLTCAADLNLITWRKEQILPESFVPQLLQNQTHVFLRYGKQFLNVFSKLPHRLFCSGPQNDKNTEL